MPDESGFAYVRSVDAAAMERGGADDRLVQVLLDDSSGATTCSVSLIRTPPRGGSPAGLHVHDVDQLFFVLSGTMSVEVYGRTLSAGPNTLVVFPAGVPHRNWNNGDEPTVHLAFNTPLPDPAAPFARRLEP